MNPPKGATHVSDFYGRNQFFKRIEYPHRNQASERWQTLARWEWWDAGQWRSVGGGFSDRNLREVPNERNEEISETKQKAGGA